ncbi:hypothetical protein Y032_0665g1328 [Ancylostoma ceylanicum]|nr:hypothetical protein Y032_0665g1328 [Ancylostoma ceylanicum]
MKLTEKNHAQLRTPLGAHRRPRQDNTNFEVTVKFLARKPRTSSRRSLEAFMRKSKNEWRQSMPLNHKGTCAMSGIAFLIRKSTPESSALVDNWRSLLPRHSSDIEVTSGPAASFAIEKQTLRFVCVVL